MTLRVAVGTAFPRLRRVSLTELLTAQERPLERVDGGASEEPGPLSPLGAACHPLKLLAPLLPEFLQFCVFQGAMSLPGTPPHGGIPEDSLAFCKVILSFTVH